MRDLRIPMRTPLHFLKHSCFAETDIVWVLRFAYPYNALIHVLCAKKQFEQALKVAAEAKEKTHGIEGYINLIIEDLKKKKAPKAVY